jgi:hypothetical protein
MQKSVTMHVLRHSAAMRLLHAGIDTSVIALWLGHENVETTLCMPIWRSRSAHWLKRGRLRLSPADSGLPANFSPFWRPSDYAASFTAIAAPRADLAVLVGIIRSAA